MPYFALRYYAMPYFTVCTILAYTRTSSTVFDFVIRICASALVMHEYPPLHTTGGKQVFECDRVRGTVSFLIPK